MNYLLGHIFIFLLLLFCSSCNTSQVEDNLESINSYINEHPDSALIALSNLTITEKDRESVQADYAILMAKALDKTFHFETNDSLISIASKYYSDGKNPLKACEANFYHAITYLYRNDLSNSMSKAIKSLYWANIIDDNYLLAKTHELMADIYSRSYNPQETISHRISAADYYKAAGKELNEIYALLDLSREYEKADNHTKSLSILDSLSCNIQTSDSTLLGYLNSSYIRPLMKSHEYELAYEKYANMKSYCGERGYSLIDIPTIVTLFTHLEQLDSAEYYLKIQEKSGGNLNNNENYHYAKYILSKAENNISESLCELEMMLEIHNTKMSKVLKNEVAFAERDFFNNEAIIEHERAQKAIIISLSTISILLIIILCIYIFYREHLKRKKIEFENKLYEVKNLRTKLSNSENSILLLKDELKMSNNQVKDLTIEINSKQDNISKQKDLIDRLFKDHFATLDNLSNEYFEKRDSNIMRTSIIKDFENEINRIKQDDSMMKLQNIVNECRDNIIDKLETQLPKLKENDLKFITLILAGFSPRSICLLTDIKIGNYYNKWTRLKARISDSDAPDKELFLSIFSK